MGRDGEAAPGRPGAGPHWESARKTGVGRACNRGSRVWFTVGDGIINEIYFPRPDLPCTKDAGFLVADGDSFFSEERQDTDQETRWFQPGIPHFNSSIHTVEAVTGFIKKSAPTLIETSFSSAHDLRRCREKPTHFISIFASHHIWAMAVATTPLRWASTKATKCFGRNLNTARWP